MRNFVKFFLRIFFVSLAVAPVAATAAGGAVPGVAQATAGTEALLSGGRVKVGVSWRDPYTGDVGAATAQQPGDEFAFFSFFSADNPEVFVKALGGNTPESIQLFAAGLTTFEYTVTFAGCGRTKTFTKPAFAKITYEDGAGFPIAGCLPVEPVTQKVLGGSKLDFPSLGHGSQAVSRTADGGFIVAGTVSSNDGDVSGNHGLFDIWVAKLGPSMDVEWQRCLGGSKYDLAGGVIPTSDGGYALIGTTNSSDGDVGKGHGLGDVWIVKLDAAGKILWQRLYGGSAWDVGISLVQTADGGFVFAAVTRSNDGDVSGNHGQYDIWVARIDKAGALVWQRCLGGSQVDMVSSLQGTSDGGFLVTGSTDSSDGDVSGAHGGRDVFVAKLGGQGTVEWVRAIGGTGDEMGNSGRQTSDGKFVIAGWTTSSDGDVGGVKGGKDALLVLLDAAGKVLWTRTYGGTNDDSAFSVVEAAKGGFVFAGETFSPDGDVTFFKGGSDAWVVQVSPSGDLVGSRCLGGSDQDSAGSVVPLPAGEGYLVAGWTGSRDGDVRGLRGDRNIWLVKLGAGELR